MLSSKLIDGTFPDYDRVIPESNDKTLEVNCDEFAAAVDRVATISTRQIQSCKAISNSGTIVLSASSPESGTASEEIEVDYSQGPIEIGFNARYLLDIAQQIDGTMAQFVMADSASPIIVRDVDDPTSSTS